MNSTVKSEVRVVADAERNLLKFSFNGDVGRAEIERFERDVEAALATMPRGYALLTDLTHLKSMQLLCVPYIERTMDRNRTCGIARIVRIIPNRRKDIGFNIMSIFHYPRGMQIITCDTMAEAERALR